MANETMVRPRLTSFVVGIVVGGGLLSCRSSTSAVISLSSSGSASPEKAQVIQPKATQTTQMITFESLGRGASYTAKLEEPILCVAGSVAEASRFTKWLDNTDLAKRIQGVDFNTKLVVAIFGGQAGSSGYGITLQEISVAPGTVQLKVKLRQPPPGEIQSAVMTYPYHIVLIPRDKFPIKPGTSWSVYSPDGKLLAQTKYP